MERAHRTRRRILLAAQSLLASEVGSDAFDATLQDLRAHALQTCETLENAREAAHSARPRSPTRTLGERRKSRIRVSAMGRAPPVAPQRESSLPAIGKRSTPTYAELSAALRAWDTAYTNFAQAWCVVLGPLLQVPDQEGAQELASARRSRSSARCPNGPARTAHLTHRLDLRPLAYDGRYRGPRPNTLDLDPRLGCANARYR
jgi:hypothetical protein